MLDLASIQRICLLEWRILRILQFIDGCSDSIIQPVATVRLAREMDEQLLRGDLGEAGSHLLTLITPTITAGRGKIRASFVSALHEL